VLTIPALGGPEHKLGEASPRVPAWSPDGKWLVIAEKSSRRTLSHYFYCQSTAEKSEN
jgi:Tol biopolymer transport system component